MKWDIKPGKEEAKCLFLIYKTKWYLEWTHSLMNTSFYEMQTIITCANYWIRHWILWKRRCNRRWMDEKESCERRCNRDWCSQIMQRLVRENSYFFLVWLGKEEEKKIHKSYVLIKCTRWRYTPFIQLSKRKTSEIDNNEKWWLERQKRST